MLNASEIVAGLGGTNAAARFFGLSAPSVSEWVRKGAIPEDKLIRKAAKLEAHPGLAGRFHRRTQWPDNFQEIWPEIERRNAPRDRECAERFGDASQLERDQPIDQDRRRAAVGEG